MPLRMPQRDAAAITRAMADAIAPVALRQAQAYRLDHHLIDDEAETARDVVEACNAALRRLRKKGKRK